MSQSCPDTKYLRLDPDSLLDLKCGSSCNGGSFEWLKRKRGQKEKAAIKLDLQGPTLTVQSVGYNDGGVYECRCLPDGPQCEQDVYGKTLYDHRYCYPARACAVRDKVIGLIS